MTRQLCSQIFYWLVQNHGFYRSYKGDSEKFHLWKSVSNSLGFVVRLNIRFEADENEKAFLLYLTDYGNGNYFKFSSLQEFQKWYECLDVAKDALSTSVSAKQREVKKKSPTQAFGGYFW